MLRASGREELTEIIHSYRMRNGIPIGNVSRDIDDFYCAKYPTFCEKELNDTDPKAPRRTDEPMLNRVSRWASMTAQTMPRGGYEMAAPAEAQRRADICAGCPQNKPWRGSCGGCSSITLQLLTAIKKMQKTARDGNLSACAIGGWDNNAGVWLSHGVLSITDADKQTLPEACWRKQNNEHSTAALTPDTK
jgi:hypothetical protein